MNIRLHLRGFTQKQTGTKSSLMKIKVFFLNTQTPSYPAGLWRAHSCLRVLCSVCSPLLPAYAEPGWQAGGVCAGPRPGLLGLEVPQEAPGSPGALLYSSRIGPRCPSTGPDCLRNCLCPHSEDPLPHWEDKDIKIEKGGEEEKSISNT